MATGRIGTTPVLTTRWSKAPAAGTTSLSGLDDNSVSLVYSVGYEAVYQNGVLLSRGNDYTATNGTTITLTTATVAGDIIEVFANQTIPLTDTYSQTVSDGRFIKNTLTTTTGDIIYASAANTPARLGIGSTDQVLTVSGGVPTWATPSSGGMTLLSTTSVSNQSTATISSISGSYTNLQVWIEGLNLSDNDGWLRLAPNGSTSLSNFVAVYTTISGSNQTNDGRDGYFPIGKSTSMGSNNSSSAFVLNFFNYAGSQAVKIITENAYYKNNQGSFGLGMISGAFVSSSAISSLVFSVPTGYYAATIKIYGVK